MLRISRTIWTTALIFGAATGTARAQVAVPPQSKIIDEHLRKTWAEAKVTPAKQANDHEFLRRVFVDVLGRVPTPEEVRDFERDKSTNKRAKVIHRLLHDEVYKLKDASGREIKGDDGKPMVFEYSREYAEHWADIWTVWLMTRAGTNELYHSQMKFWLEKAFMNNMPHDTMVRELLTAKGKGTENGGVSNFVMAHLGEPNQQRITDGPFDAIPITSRVTRLFLGVQTQCTQCHDHPFNPEWGQENFWGVNAFFRSTTRDQTPAPASGAAKKNKAMMAQPITVSDDPRLNDSMRIFYERRTGVLMSIKPQFLPNLADLEKDKTEREKKGMPANGKGRREVLADYVIAHDNFSKAFVNRMWGHFFGRGMNEQPAVDDFGGHNKIIHPALLEDIGKEFAKYKYDPKMLIEWICNSEAYNLSYVAPTREMAKPDLEVYFARMPLKSMSPEVLFESLATATRADMQVDKEARKAARENWMNKLVRNFGDDEGNEMNFNGTIVQALLMMNGKEINDEIKRKDGLVAKLIAKSAKMSNRDQYIIDEIYLTALGRRPKTVDIETIDPKTKLKTTSPLNEYTFVKAQLERAKTGHVAPVEPKSKSKGKPAPAPKGDPVGVYQSFFEDLFWTLLNTNEFMLNH
jgi:hypothetical protein